MNVQAGSVAFGGAGRDANGGMGQWAVGGAGIRDRRCRARLLSGGGTFDRRRNDRDERRISGVLQEIETRYTEPLSIAELACIARMSPWHFMRIFRDVVGVTPYQYLLRTRLRHAAVELGTT